MNQPPCESEGDKDEEQKDECELKRLIPYLFLPCSNFGL